MSDWLHCNVCLRLPREETDVPFFFTSCGHVLCGKCSNTDVQIFFRDPKDLVKRYVDNVIAVLDFQNGHRSRLNKAQLEQVSLL
uniref:RING-type domain-containing protein n=1 Tax=Parascaris equorum TaxID=6256 RepID=A0A914R747_PAREQ